MKDELLKAVEFALAGRWDDAHGIVQRYEQDTTAAWIHAVLHKMEGNLANSRYWYSRAGETEHFSDEPQSELRQIQQKLESE